MYRQIIYVLLVVLASFWCQGAPLSPTSSECSPCDLPCSRETTPDVATCGGRCLCPMWPQPQAPASQPQDNCGIEIPCPGHCAVGIDERGCGLCSCPEQALNISLGIFPVCPELGECDSDSGCGWTVSFSDGCPVCTCSPKPCDAAITCPELCTAAPDENGCMQCNCPQFKERVCKEESPCPWYCAVGINEDGCQTCECGNNRFPEEIEAKKPMDSTKP